jgi:hypothetical protein
MEIQAQTLHIALQHIDESPSTILDSANHCEPLARTMQTGSRGSNITDRSSCEKIVHEKHFLASIKVASCHGISTGHQLADQLANVGCSLI